MSEKMNEEKIERFRALLSSAFDGRQDDMRAAQQQLDDLMLTDYVLFLALAAEVGSRSTGKELYFCLVAIKNALKVTRYRSIEQIRKMLLPDEVLPVRNSVKSLVLKHLTSTEVPIQNMSAAVVAEVLQFECVLSCSWFGEIMAQKLSVPVVVNVFTEIFQAKVFSTSAPVESLPAQLEQLLGVINQTMRNPETQNDGKVACAKCLKLMIKAVPQVFQSEEQYKNLFGLLKSVVPSALPNLYVQIHMIVLQLVESLYFITDRVMEDVFEFNLQCLHAPHLEMKLIALEFWEQLWEFEKTVARRERVNGLGVSVAGKLRPMVPKVATAGPQILQGAVPMLDMVKMSGGVPGDDFVTPEERIFNVLKAVCNALKFYGTGNQDVDAFFMLIEQTVDTFLSLIQQRTEVTDPPDVNVLIYLLRLVTIWCNWPNANSAVQENVQRVQEKVQQVVIEKIQLATMAAVRGDAPRLCDNAITFLTDLAKEFPSAFERDAVFEGLFTTFTRVMTGPMYVQFKGMQMMTAVIKAAPPRVVDGFYEPISEIVSQCIDAPSFDDARYNNAALRTMNALFAGCSSQMNDTLLDLVGTLLQRIDSAPFERKTSYLGMITRIVQHLQSYIRPKLPDLCAFLFRVLENPTTLLYLEAMICFAAVILGAKADFKPYGPAFTSTVVSALNSKEPRLVTFAALAFGDFCQIVGKENYQEIKGVIECLCRIMELTKHADEVTQQVVVPDTLYSMSRVLRGMNDALSPEFIPRLWDLIIFYANTYVDLESENDIEYATRLYIGAFHAMASWIIILPSNAKEEVSYVAQMKRSVFPLLDRAWRLRSDHPYLLLASLELIEALGAKFGARVNIPLHRESIKCLMNVATSSTDRQVQQCGIRVQEFVRKL